MTRTPPPCFRRKQFGRHKSFAPRMLLPATLAHMPDVRKYPMQGSIFLAQHATAAPQKQKKNEIENFGEKKKSPSPFHVILFCPFGTPCTGQKVEKNKQQSFSLCLVRRPPLSRPPRHRFGPGKVVLSLCHSEPRRPPRVKPGDHRGPRSPA